MKRDITLEAKVVAKFAAVSSVLDERGRRLWAAAESRSLGWGGDALVSSATGLARETIRKGRREFGRGFEPSDRIRRPGAGRPGIEATQPGIKEALERLVDPLTRGDPGSPLRWTCKSRAKLAAALTMQGWAVSSTTVGRRLNELGYRLQSVRKSQEGAAQPDRNAQFEHIDATAEAFLATGEPVISVDTKKKELVGDFRNAGREWQPSGVQGLADETGLRIRVSHFPPGTSKWSKIEHRLFCHITQNWRGEPLRTFETVVDLIGNTRTGAGLRVRATLDEGTYPTGAKVMNAQMKALSLKRHDFHGDRNYELHPCTVVGDTKFAR